MPYSAGMEPDTHSPTPDAPHAVRTAIAALIAEDAYSVHEHRRYRATVNFQKRADDQVAFIIQLTANAERVPYMPYYEERATMAIPVAMLPAYADAFVAECRTQPQLSLKNPTAVMERMQAWLDANSDGIASRPKAPKEPPLVSSGALRPTRGAEDLGVEQKPVGDVLKHLYLSDSSRNAPGRTHTLRYVVDATACTIDLTLEAVDPVRNTYASYCKTARIAFPDGTLAATRADIAACAQYFGFHLAEGGKPASTIVTPAPVVRTTQGVDRKEAQPEAPAHKRLHAITPLKTAYDTQYDGMAEIAHAIDQLAAFPRPRGIVGLSLRPETGSNAVLTITYRVNGEEYKYPIALKDAVLTKAGASFVKPETLDAVVRAIARKCPEFLSPSGEMEPLPVTRLRAMLGDPNTAVRQQR